MTPRMFDALTRAWNKRKRVEAELSCVAPLILTNIYRDRDEHPNPYTMEDFLSSGEPKKKQTPEQMFCVVEMLNAAFGGKVVEM